MGEDWKEYKLDRPLSLGESVRRRVAASKLEEFARRECHDGWTASEAVTQDSGMFILTAKDGRQASIGYSYDMEAQ